MAKKLDAKRIEEARRKKVENKRGEFEKQQIREAFENNKNNSRVVIIPPKAVPVEDNAIKIRVCAYCRVSTAEENQAGSFEIQCQHFKQVIESNPNWQFAGIFSDEGISGTTVEKRKGFQSMIEAAQNHEIEIFLRTLIQYLAHGSAENGLKQRLSADLDGLPKALFFWGVEVEE